MNGEVAFGFLRLYASRENTGLQGKPDPGADRIDRA